MIVSNEVRHSWSNKPLGELVQFLDNMRVPLKKSDRAKRRGSIPYYGANGQVDWIDEYLFNESLVLLAEDGGFFGSKERPIAYKIIGKSWVNNHAHVLRPKPEIDIDYLHWILSFYDVKPFLSGSTRFKLTKSDASRMPISYPLDIQEQKRIAGTLNKADALKQKREQANQIANSILQAVFVQMFGDPATNPMQWQISRIGDYARIRYGTGSPPPYERSGIPFIRATNIKMGKIVKKEMKFISSESASKIEKCKLHEGNLLLVRSGANTGDCAFVPIEYDGSYAAYDLILEFNKDLNSRFVWALMNMNYGRSIMKPLTKRAAQPHINAEQVSAIKVPKPPIELQQRFATIIQKLNDVQEKQENTIQEIRVLFNSLMSKAFKGELVQ